MKKLFLVLGSILLAFSAPSQNGHLPPVSFPGGHTTGK
jgi:hypothetical protein